MNKKDINYLVSIVMPVYNKWNFTKSALKDLSKLPDNHEVIIVDNNSTDDTNEEISNFLDEHYKNNPFKCNFHYIANEQNEFHSKACNQGFQHSFGEYILFFNNDIRVKSNHENWTKKIVDACNSTQGIVGPTMGLLDAKLNFVKEANQQLEGNSYLGGWCIGAHRDTWNKLKVGKGHKNFQVWNEEFPFYFNDGDLSFRARKLGIPLTCINLPEVVHFGKVSAAQINIPKLYAEGRTVFLKHWSK